MLISSPGSGFTQSIPANRYPRGPGYLGLQIRENKLGQLMWSRGNGRGTGVQEKSGDMQCAITHVTLYNTFLVCIVNEG